MNNERKKTLVLTWILPITIGTALWAQQSESLSLKQAVALALENSGELSLTRAQHDVADKTVALNR